MNSRPSALLDGRVPATAPPIDEDALVRDEAARFRSRHRRALTRVLSWRVIALVALLAAWSVASGPIVDKLFVSNPADVAKAFRTYLDDGRLVDELQYTMLEVVVGYVCGATAALVLAGLVSLSDGVQRVMRPYLMAFYATPKIALAPLIVMWFGLGVTPKFILAGLFVFFVVFMSTLSGLQSVSPNLVNVARVMGAGRITLLLKVVYPTALPIIFTALRITVPEAMVGAIVGEFIAGNRGIGYLINSASSQYDTASVFAGILAILVVVLFMDWIVSLFERRMLRWRPQRTRG